MKTYNDWLSTEYGEQLNILKNLGADAAFVVQAYGTQTAPPFEQNWGDGITPNSHFVDVERRVEMRVTMVGSYYSLLWHRDSETLDAFDMVRAASMASRFVADIDSLLPMLKERLEYMKAAKGDINDPINYALFDTVYRGGDDNIWYIQNHRLGKGINKIDDVLNAVVVEAPGMSYIRQLETLYSGSKLTCTTKAIFNTVMNQTLVHSGIDCCDRPIYDVAEFEGLQIKVSFDEDGILFRPTYLGEDLTDDLSRSLLSLDGQCIFACESGGESLHMFWDEVGCSFEDFDDAQWKSDLLTVFKQAKRGELQACLADA
jgi:hypothetical protein